MEAKIAEVIELINTVAEDTSVPKNIRRALVDAREKLRSKEDFSTRIGSAVYLIEAISEDINMPMHARTQIWAILSALESIKT